MPKQRKLQRHLKAQREKIVKRRFSQKSDLNPRVTEGRIIMDPGLSLERNNVLSVEVDVKEEFSINEGDGDFSTINYENTRSSSCASTVGVQEESQSHALTNITSVDVREISGELKIKFENESLVEGVVAENTCKTDLNPVIKKEVIMDPGVSSESKKFGPVEVYVKEDIVIKDEDLDFSSMNYENTTVDNKDNPRKEVQARRKYIRHASSKDCKKHTTDNKSGSEAVKSRRYIVCDQLSFLRKVTGNRTTTNHLSSDKETQEMSGHATQNSDSPQSVQHSAQTVPTKRKITLEERMMKFMEDNEEQKDADEDFFMSMLPSVRTLNEDQKMKFRMQVILSLQNVRSGRYRQSVNTVGYASPNTLPHTQHPYQAYSHSAAIPQ